MILFRKIIKQKILTMAQKDNITLLQHFQNLAESRTNYELKGVMAAQFDYLEYLIHGQFDKNLKVKYKHKKRKAQMDQQYIRAVNILTREEKISYFDKGIKMLKNIMEEQQDKPNSVEFQPMTAQAFIRSFNLKIWKQKKIRLDRIKHTLYAQRQQKIKHYNLGDFLFRKSRNKDYHCFVLQAINSNPHEKSRTIHVGFSNVQQYMRWNKAIQNSVDIKRMQIYRVKMGKQPEILSKSSINSFTFKNQQMGKKTQSIQSLDNHKNQDKIAKIFTQEDKSLSNSYVSSQPVKNDTNQLQNSLVSKNLNKKESQKYDQSDQQEIKPQYTIEPEHKTEDFSPLSTITIINTLIESDNDEQIDQIEIQQQKASPSQKQHLDLFHKILPDYEFEDLQTEENYETVKVEGGMRIAQNRENKKKLKIFLTFDEDIDQNLIMNAISDPNYYQSINSEVEEISIKTMIGSENSAIIYQKLKSYNKFYRPRDFIYIRHIFKNASDHYVIDKSIENSNFPPFITIIRGQLTILYGILKRNNKTILIIDHEQTNLGYLNDVQQYNLTYKAISYLTSLQINIRKDQQKLKNTKLFDLSWDITKNEKNIQENKIRMIRKSQRMTIKAMEEKQQIQQAKKQTKQVQNSKFKKKNIKSIQTKKNQNSQPIIQSSQKKYNEPQTPLFSLSPVKTISDMEIKGEIDEKQLKQQEQHKKFLQQKVVREFDSKGYVIISKKFINNKYALNPFSNVPYEYQEVVVDHPIWKGQWKHDEKDGGIIFINQKKINDQKGVLKFILTKVGKNLISGKSILNISLPVDIFCGQSNLQRLLFSMTYAPILLQKVAKQSTLNRMKAIVAFGMTNSPLYLNMQKPFNPILGQTFQCWINGCPAYAQQISHHPPIGSIYFIGRGYKISAQLESKVQLHMNSGCGTNDGIYRITFQDGQQFCFITPGGEISGLTYGDRKFNMVGKAFYWCEQQRYFVELVFNPTKKGFFSIGKQQMPSDYFQGTLYEVKSEFLKGFSEKRKSPTQKDITKEIGKFSGIWSQTYTFNNEVIFNLNKEYPVKLEYEANPLPSDANWREDITYRRMIEISRAQTEKQRLEVFQRNDRKLRQTKHKK